MSDARDRLRATLGTPALERLVSRLRRSVERGAPYGRVTIADPSREERDAIDRLLGRRPSSGRVTVDAAVLEEKLRHAELSETLADAVEALTGPVLRPLADARALKASWSELETHAATRVEREPSLQEWWQSLRAEGLLRRLSGGSPEKAGALLEAALSLLTRLPVDSVPLAELAADVAGDSHGLDAGEPLATLVLRALAIRLGDREGEPRELWARMGVVPDALSAPVLVLNLRAEGDGVLARTLRAHADAGEPFHVTLRALERETPVFSLPRGRVVFACENPSIVAAAAERLGARSLSLLCTSGQARAALRSLVRRLREAGAEIRYHGDFDWPGVQIAKGLMAREGVLPWRMSAADYLAAPVGPPLRGQSVETPWDVELSVAMERRGVAVQEEHVVVSLLADLNEATRRGATEDDRFVDGESPPPTHAERLSPSS